jgi:hypothetical protein
LISIRPNLLEEEEEETEGEEGVFGSDAQSVPEIIIN